MCLVRSDEGVDSSGVRGSANLLAARLHSPNKFDADTASIHQDQPIAIRRRGVVRCHLILFPHELVEPFVQDITGCTGFAHCAFQAEHRNRAQGELFHGGDACPGVIKQLEVHHARLPLLTSGRFHPDRAAGSVIAAEPGDANRQMDLLWIFIGKNGFCDSEARIGNDGMHPIAVTGQVGFRR